MGGQVGEGGRNLTIYFNIFIFRFKPWSSVENGDFSKKTKIILRSFGSFVGATKVKIWDDILTLY